MKVRNLLHLLHGLIVQPYPKHLLPSEDKAKYFKYCDQCYLCRWTETQDELFSVDGGINISEIKEEWLNSLFSTNYILCNDGHPLTSKIDDIYLHVPDTNLSMVKWIPGAIVPNPRRINYIIKKKRGFFFIRFGVLDGFESTYPKNVPKKKEKQQFTFKIEVEHFPTLINFFHFQLAIEADGKKLNNLSGSEWKREIRHTLIAEIRKNAKSIHEINLN